MTPRDARIYCRPRLAPSHIVRLYDSFEDLLDQLHASVTVGGTAKVLMDLGEAVDDAMTVETRILADDARLVGEPAPTAGNVLAFRESDREASVKLLLRGEKLLICDHCKARDSIPIQYSDNQPCSAECGGTMRAWNPNADAVVSGAIAAELGAG